MQPKASILREPWKDSRVHTDFLQANGNVPPKHYVELERILLPTNKPEPGSANFMKALEPGKRASCRTARAGVPESVIRPFFRLFRL